MTEPITLTRFRAPDEPATRGDFARLEARSARLEARLELITKHLVASPRRSLSEKTKQQHRRTIELFFGRRCPCCGRRGVFGPKCGEFDHWTDNRNRNGAHETWLICVECHDGFSRGTLRRDEHRTHFDYYQVRRRQANSELPGL